MTVPLPLDPPPRLWATVSLDADEQRVVWVVSVENDAGELVEWRPFAHREDAQDYADRFRTEC